MTSSTATRVKGLAQTVLGKTRHANTNSDWQERLAILLKQRRNVLNFAEYTVSESHQQRMKHLAKTLPQVFDNPSITPRSKWFDHPNYRRNSQMPPFHVHFRQEMQTVLGYLDQAHQHILDKKSPHQLCQRALRQFQGCMGGLNGHVRIEEYRLFPVYQHLHPEMDLGFLKEDHGHLHETESTVMQALHELMESADSFSPSDNNDTDSSSSLQDQLVSTIQLVMDFDQQLLGHLGEEEEIVVPITLAHSGRLPL